MTLSSRLAVMDKGRIMQIGTSTEIYEYPGNRQVAGFIGSINFFAATVLGRQDGMLRLDVPDLGGTMLAADVGGVDTGDAVTLAVRPEKLVISRNQPDETNRARGTVEGLAYFGKDSLYRIRLPGRGLVSAMSVNSRRAGEDERVADWEDQVWLSFDARSAIVLTS